MHYVYKQTMSITELRLTPNRSDLDESFSLLNKKHRSHERRELGFLESLSNDERRYLEGVHAHLPLAPDWDGMNRTRNTRICKRLYRHHGDCSPATEVGA
jgi:hypothetical protein